MSVRNLVLILMFGGLLYGGYYLYHSHATQPLQADLITIDTARISRLRIHPKVEGGKVFQLQREEGYWIVSNGQVHLRALAQPVRQILSNLVKITTVEVAAKGDADWQYYGLSPAQSVRVEVYEDNKLTEDFWVGRSGPDPEGADSLSYVRIQGEQEVYAVRGLTTLPFRRNFAHFRPKTILSLPAGTTIDSFAYQLPDTLLTFEKVGGAWQRNGIGLSDTTAVEDYLEELRHLESTNFLDDFDHQKLDGNKYRSLILYLSGAVPPILIDVYRDTLREQPYILRSTQNPTSWFSSDSSGVYRLLFRELAEI